MGDIRDAYEVGDIVSISGEPKQAIVRRGLDLNRPGTLGIELYNGKIVEVPMGQVTNLSMAGRRAGGGRVDGAIPKKRYDRSPRKGK